eukprot:TRINITY_DN1957_c0_g1_i7.p1 TRINITY_DN1957_c0_g1~~TRINITY_DN1957_c0_g1_i7.p1  ORF type:complete len:2030 (-),score=783.28 TRINITY_DN1957_c0_g1_i7:201-6290(-)
MDFPVENANVIASDRTNSKLSVDIPLNKEKLMEKLRGMTYKKRIETISRLGRDNAKNPEKILKLIAELKEHPNLANPSINADDDFMDILPGQELNVEKHFTEEQLAVFLASSLGSVSVPFFQKELESNSFFLKNKSIKEFVRLEKSDQKVFEASKSTVHKVKMGIVKEAIKQDRNSLVDLFYNDLKESSPNIVSTFFYGCTSPLVKSELLRNKEIYNAAYKKKMAKVHGEVVLEILHKELEETPLLSRSGVWRFWLSENVAHFDVKWEEKLLKLALRFPVVQWIGKSKYNDSQEIDKVNMRVDLPTELQCKIPRFILGFPGPLYDFWRIYSRNSSRELVPSLSKDMWNVGHRLDYLTRFFEEFALEKKDENPSTLKEYVVENFVKISSVIQSNLIEKTHENVKKYLDFVVTYFTRTPRDTYFESERKWAETFKNSFSGFNSDPTQFSGEIVNAFIRIFKTRGEPETGTWKGIATVTYNSDSVASLFSEFRSAHGLERLWDEVITDPKMTRSTFFHGATAFPSTFNVFLDITFVLLKSKDLKEERRNQILAFRRKILEKLWKEIEEKKAEVPPTESKYVLPGSLFLSEKFKFFQAGKLEEKIVSETQKFNANELVSLFEILLCSLQDLQNGVTSDIDSEFDAKAAYTQVQNVLKKVLESPLTPKSKEVLFRFRDIKLDENWNLMTKEAASASRSEREINIQRLIDAVHLSRDPQKLVNLLTFVWGRIKNEVEETKESLMMKMVTREKWAVESEIVRKAYLDLFREFLSTKTCEVSEEMKEMFTPGKTTFVSSLYSEDSTLVFFYELAEFVFYTCLNPKISKEEFESRFQFGASIQFELFEYYVGPSLSSLHFQFNLKDGWGGASGSAYPASESSELERSDKPRRRRPRQPWSSLSEPRRSKKRSGKAKESEKFNEKLLWLVDRISQFYLDHLDAEVLKSARGYNYLMLEFVNMLGGSWYKSPKLVEHVDKLINETCMAVPRDDDGALIMEKDDPLLDLYKSLKNALRNQSKNYCVESFNRLVKTILKSHSCETVFFSFYNYYANHREGTVSSAGDERTPDESQFRIKNPLEKMIAKDRTIRFLLKNSASSVRVRLVWRHLVSVRQDLLDPYLGAKSSFRGIYSKIGTKAGTSGPPMRGGRFGRGAARPLPKTVQQTVEEEKNKEIALKKFFKDKPERRDHPDLFVLPATYGLRKLNQSQSKVLAQDLYDRMENMDLPLANRSKASKAWTLVPSTNYPDVVSYLNDKVEGKSQKEYPIQFVKTLYSGLLMGDDPIAPIHFLLSPTTLSKKEYSQVSIYSLSKCIPVTRTSTFVGLLRVLLDVKRRKEMTVSIHKQIVRLIGSKPSEESLSLLMAELGRKELHRDVRIAASTMLTQFLTLSELKNEAWKAILASSKRINADELIVLLAAEPMEGESPSVGIRDDLLLTPQLQEQWSTLRGQMKIPKEFAERFAREIITPLSKIEKIKQTEKLEDLKLIATFATWTWARYMNHEEIAAKMTELLMRRGEETLKPYLNGLDHFHSQNKYASEILVNLCTESATSDFKGEANKRHIYQVIEGFCTAISEAKDQTMRELHMNHLECFLDLLTPSRFPWEYEEVAVAPIKRLGIYTSRLFLREISRLNEGSSMERAKEMCLRAVQIQLDCPSFGAAEKIALIQGKFGVNDQYLLYEFLMKKEYPSKRLQINHDTTMLGFSKDRSALLRRYTNEILNLLQRVANNFYVSEAVTTDYVVTLMLAHRVVPTNPKNQERFTDKLFSFVLEKVLVDFEAPFYSDWIRGYLPQIDNFGTEEEIEKLFQVLVDYQFKNRRNHQTENAVSDLLAALQRRSSVKFSEKLLNQILSGSLYQKGGEHAQVHFLLEQAGNYLRKLVPGYFSSSEDHFKKSLPLLLSYIYECSLYIVAVGKPWGDAASSELVKIVQEVNSNTHKDRTSEFALKLAKHEGVDALQFNLISTVLSKEDIKELASTAQFHHLCVALSYQLLQKCGSISIKTKENPTPKVNPLNPNIAPEFEPVLQTLANDSDSFIKENALKFA